MGPGPYMVLGAHAISGSGCPVMAGLKALCGFKDQGPRGRALKHLGLDRDGTARFYS